MQTLYLSIYTLTAQEEGYKPVGWYNFLAF